MNRQRAWTSLVAVALLAAFAPGLAGPFVLDDHVNLAPVWEWLHGSRPARETLFGGSGPGGRPLAYSTLMANAWVGGEATFGFKLVNLALHAGNTLLVYCLARRCFALAGRDASAPLALAVAAVWALHPMQVSSVLYVVQRMALLGATAQLASVLLYLQARTCVDAADGRRRLFLGIPLVVIGGALGKETALLAPVLCLVAEGTVLAGVPRRREHLFFFVATLAIPALIALGWIALHPGWLAQGYIGREFTMEQRLLTQPRVLLDYAASWCWPANLALYRDGYGPLTTLTQAWPAMAGMASATMIALLFRRRAMLVAFGVLWFIAAHALEAGPIALELFFEHRNYLASLGLAVIVAGILPARAAVPVLASLSIALGLFTLQRSLDWAELPTMLASEAPPDGEISRRLQVDRAIHAAVTQDVAARTQALDVLDAGNAGDRAAAAIWRLVFACDVDGRVSTAQLDAAMRAVPSVLTHGHVSWLALAARRATARSCPGMGPPQIAALLDAWQRGSRQPISAGASSRMTELRRQLGATP